MRALRALLLALIVASPSLTLAETEHPDLSAQASGHEPIEESHGAHGELSISALFKSPEFLGTLVNFTVLVLLLAWVIRKKGNPALAARRAEVEEELAEAQRLRAEAERRHNEAASRLEKLDKEVAEIRAEMIKAGEAERDRIVAQAEEKAARVRKDTNFLIEQQIKQLRQDLTEHAANAAIAAARELLEERTTNEDHERLAEAYLTRLDEVIEERQS
jgi:F-type H+-transporting ATPase subunit b